MHRWDFSELPRPRRDKNGFLVAPRTRIARTGVQIYQDADGSTHRELRLPEDVGSPSALSSISGKPVTIGHPGEVTSQNVTQHAVGSSGLAEMVDDLVEADLYIWTEGAQRAAEVGANEVSLGYSIRRERIPGGVFRQTGHRFDGVEAEFIQRDIEVNHIALVNRGRANQGRSDRPVRLRLDADGNQTSPGVEAQEDTMETVDITINGKTFKVDKAVASAYQAEAAARPAAQVRNDADSGELAALKARLDKAEARADKADADLAAEKSKAQDEESLAKQQRKDAERLALAVEVAQITGEEAKDLVVLDSDALRTKAITKLSPDLPLEGKSADYKLAMYDMLRAQKVSGSTQSGQRKDSATDIQQALTGGKKDNKADGYVSPLAQATRERHDQFFGRNQKAQ